VIPRKAVGHHDLGSKEYGLRVDGPVLVKLVVVAASRENPEVYWPVVVLDSVGVVDGLSPQEMPLKDLFSDHPMDFAGLAANGRAKVTMASFAAPKGRMIGPSQGNFLERPPGDSKSFHRLQDSVIVCPNSGCNLWNT
jgi:hypothetical protein